MTAGDCFTNVLCVASASGVHRQTTVDALQLAADVRKLRTRPRPQRLRLAPTLADVTALLQRVQQDARDAETLVAATELAAPAGLGEGYEDLIAELDETRRRVGTPEAELAVTKRLVRRLLTDVRTLAAAQQRLQ